MRPDNPEIGRFTGWRLRRRSSRFMPIICVLRRMQLAICSWQYWQLDCLRRSDRSCVLRKIPDGLTTRRMPMRKLIFSAFLILVVSILGSTKAHAQTGWAPAIAAIYPSGCTQWGISPGNSTCVTAAATCQMWSTEYSSPYTIVIPFVSGG